MYHAISGVGHCLSWLNGLRENKRLWRNQQQALESAAIPVLIIWILVEIQSRLICSECYFFASSFFDSLPFVVAIPAKVARSHFKSTQVSKHSDFIRAMSSTKVVDVENLQRYWIFWTPSKMVSTIRRILCMVSSFQLCDQKPMASHAFEWASHLGETYKFPPIRVYADDSAVYLHDA